MKLKNNVLLRLNATKVILVCESSLLNLPEIKIITPH